MPRRLLQRFAAVTLLVLCAPQAAHAGYVIGRGKYDTLTALKFRNYVEKAIADIKSTLPHDCLHVQPAGHERVSDGLPVTSPQPRSTGKLDRPVLREQCAFRSDE